jgi:putative hydrolase of the HAD superfamily
MSEAAKGFGKTGDALLREDFRGVESWIFDLDNTLYPASCDLFAEIEMRMGLFISQLLGLDREAAHALRQRYYREHGTTLAGLMARHGTNPRHFMSFVHDIDLSLIPPNPQLCALLGRLPGRKLVFTNGSAAHAQRVMARVGIEDHFCSVFDIEAADFVPKPSPETMDALLHHHAIEPKRAAMFDDIAANLLPAHALGMKTVWIRTPKNYAPGAAPIPAAHIHHETDDLTKFLAEAVLTDTE